MVMKKLMLMICLVGALSATATAQNSSQQVNNRPSEARPVNQISAHTYNYPSNVPNTDNKDLNKNDKIDKYEPNNVVTDMANPLEHKRVKHCWISQ